MPLFPTSLVGSYPQPDWLIDKAKLKEDSRTRAAELWRVDGLHIEEAFADAAALWSDQLAAADDTDGEAQRELPNRLATAPDGVDIDNPGEALIEVENRCPCYAHWPD